MRRCMATAAKDSQRMKRLILKAGLNPPHFNNTEGFAQNMCPKGAQRHKDKATYGGKISIKRLVI